MLTHILIRLPVDNYLMLNGYTYFIYIIDSRFIENKMFDNLVSGVLNVYRVLFGCFSSTVDTVLALKVATLAMAE
jgi:hypothetical protein